MTKRRDLYVSHSARRIVSGALLCAAVLALAACSDPEAPALSSLRAPMRVTTIHACSTLSGESPHRVAVEDSRCSSRDAIVNVSYVTNKLSESVAVIDLDGDIPEVVDVRADIPGVTHIQVGRGPTEIVSTHDGNFLFVYNEIDRDISVVFAASRAEVARIPLGEALTSMLYTFKTNDEGGVTDEAIWLLLPERGELRKLTWEATCADNAFVADCGPDIAAQIETAFSFGAEAYPRFATLHPDQQSLFVTFSDRGHMEEILLGDTAEGRTCLSGSAPCVARQFGLTTGCADGIDNDGDGLVDAQDPQCLSLNSSEDGQGVTRAIFSACNDGVDNDGDGRTDADDPGCIFSGDQSEQGAVKLPACSDGIDNDGDGLVDAADGECPDPSHNNEAALPQCSDGVDNDGDGLTDGEEGACSDPLGETESPGDTACNDGIDNDGDGAIDLDDPACDSPFDNSEISGLSVCNDGVDNDGDGAIDYPNDTDCYGVNGASEESFQNFELGPISIDPEGRFAYVVDRINTQVLLVDLTTGKLVDPSNCGADEACARRRFDARIGIPLGRIPNTVEARQEEVLRQELDGEGRFLVHKVAFANVGTSRGTLYYANAALISGIEENGVFTESHTQLLGRLDDDSGASPFASSIRCGLSRETLERVRVVRGTEVAGEVTCGSPELPQIVLPPGVCEPTGEPGDETCACETGPGDVEVCTHRNRNVDFPVRLLTRPNTALKAEVDEAGNVQEPELVTERVFDDFFIPDDTWSVTYEGVALERSDALVDNDLPGIIRTNSGDFCEGGVQEGDLLTILGSPTPLSGEECDAFQDRELTWRVGSVSGSFLKLEVLSPEEAQGLNRTEAERQAVVQELPTRGCFAAGVSVEVRAEKAWVVRGERSGHLHSQESIGNVCVPTAEDYKGRIRAGEDFVNPYFSFSLVAGEIVPPRDYSLNFTTRSNFRASSLTIGAASTEVSTVTVMEKEGAESEYIFVLDSAANLIRVYPDTGSRLRTVLF